MNVHGRWDDPADDTRCIRWARDFFAAAAPFATGGVHVNFLTADEGKRVRAAYGANYALLVQVKRQYDADNLFRMNQNITRSNCALSRPAGAAGVEMVKVRLSLAGRDWGPTPTLSCGVAFPGSRTMRARGYFWQARVDEVRGRTRRVPPAPAGAAPGPRHDRRPRRICSADNFPRDDGTEVA
jgi:hypothetical protein